MKEISSELGNLMGSAKSSREMQSTEPQPSQTPARIEKATPLYIMELIGEVELSCQIKPPLTEQQRLQLRFDLERLNESPAKLRARADSVKLRTDTFGTIAFKYWVEGDLVCLRSEMLATAEYRAAQIVARQNLATLFNEEATQAAAITRFNYLCEEKFEALVQAKYERLQTNVQQAKAKVRAMSIGQRTRLIKKAVKEKLLPAFDMTLVEYAHADDIVRQLLPLLKG